MHDEVRLSTCYNAAFWTQWCFILLFKSTCIAHCSFSHDYLHFIFPLSFCRYVECYIDMSGYSFVSANLVSTTALNSTSSSVLILFVATLDCCCWLLPLSLKKFQNCILCHNIKFIFAIMMIIIHENRHAFVNFL